MSRRPLLVVLACALLSLGRADRGCLQDSSFVHAREVAANFTQCVLKFSAPSRVCLKCGTLKSSWGVAYSALSSTCQDYWAITDMNNFISSASGLWADANCDGCTSAQLLHFRHLACTAESCLLQRTPSYCVDILSPSNTSYGAAKPGEFAGNSSDGSAAAQCLACKAEVDALSDNYGSLSNQCKRARDIIDQQQLVQDTRATLACASPEIQQLVFALSAAVCIVPPLLFYWLAFLFGRRSLSSVMLLRTVDSEAPDSPVRRATEFDSSRVHTRAPASPMHAAERPQLQVAARPPSSLSRHRRSASYDDNAGELSIQ